MAGYWSERDLARMQGVNPQLVEMMSALREQGHNFQITEGLRDEARQRELLDAGKSKTMNSKHLTGNAMDIVMIDPETGKAIWDEEAYAPVGAAAKEYAKQHGLDDFTWGGDWGWDSVNFQLDNSKYRPTEELIAAGIAAGPAGSGGSYKGTPVPVAHQAGPPAHQAGVTDAPPSFYEDEYADNWLGRVSKNKDTMRAGLGDKLGIDAKQMGNIGTGLQGLGGFISRGGFG